MTGGPKGYPFFYNHLAAVIGWGTQNNTNYWIIKNSWSESWGEKGFAKFKRGVNIRSLNDFAVYPIL
jgi:cathepsin C